MLASPETTSSHRGGMIRGASLGAATGVVAGPAAALVVGVGIFAIYGLWASRDTPGLSGLPIAVIFFVFSMLVLGPITGALTGAITAGIRNRNSAVIAGAVAGFAVGAVVGMLLNPNVYIPGTYGLINSVTAIVVVGVATRVGKGKA